MKVEINTTTKEKSDAALIRIFKHLALYRDWLHVECFIEDDKIEFGVQEDTKGLELTYYTLMDTKPLPMRKYIDDFRQHVVLWQGEKRKKSRAFVNVVELIKSGHSDYFFSHFKKEELQKALKNFDLLEYNYQKNDFALVLRILIEKVGQLQDPKENKENTEKKSKTNKTTSTSL